MPRATPSRPSSRVEGLGDFTASVRMLPISAVAVGLGVLGAYLAKGLLALIALFTNVHPGSNTCSSSKNGCGTYDYDCVGGETECNAPQDTCPADGLCSTITGVCLMSSCKRYGYGFDGFACGIHSYVVSTDTCTNNGSCDLSTSQDQGNPMACH